MNFTSVFGLKEKETAQVAVTEKPAVTGPTKGEAKIREYFESLGIESSEIIPRVNVLTFNAWLDQGRVVKKGEHGCKLMVLKDGDKEGKKRPFWYSVFHVSQTQPKENK